MTGRAVRRAVAAALILDALNSSAWLAGVLPEVSAFSALTLGLIAARLVTAGAEFAAGWLLWVDRPPGPRLAQGALVVSAALVALETGCRLAPSNVIPDFRWPIVAGYAALAAISIALLQRRGE